MAKPPSHSANRGAAPHPGDRLDSWKAIAAYLKRDVTTVRRWEKREGLPVHRHVHDKLGTVYAYKNDIDDWWQGRSSRLDESDPDVHLGEQHRVADHPAPDAQWARIRHRERLAWALAATFFSVAVLATAIVISTYSRTGVDQTEYRFSVSSPDRGDLGTVAVSPDGRHMSFTASGADGIARLWIRRLDSLAAQPFAATDGAAFPFWSPDSRFVGFFAGGKLKKIAASGGTPQVLCDAPEGRGGAWNRDDVILFAPGREQALHRVAATGGVPAPVTDVDRSRHRGHLWPEFLPDGRHFLYLADSVEAGQHSIYVGALGTHLAKRLLQARSNAIHAAGGFLLFARGGSLVSQRFDVRTLELTGEPTIVADRVLQPYGRDHRGDFSTSRNGVLAFRSGGSLLKQLVWIDRRGNRLNALGEPANYAEPVLSPDETRVAVSIFDPDPQVLVSDIWVLDASTAARSRLTFEQAADFEPEWSPDGSHVAFASNRRGTLDLYRKRVSGSGPDELLFKSDTPKHPEAWSADGRFLTYSTLDSKTKYDVWILPLFGDRKPLPFLQSEVSEGQSQISPNGRWIAYTSYETGRMEVYVRAFPAGEGKWQISSNGGADPRWRRDGRELFYIATDGTLMAMTVESGRAFKPGAPQALFDTQINHLWDDARNHYDVAHDGDRFLVTVPVESFGALPFTVVVNWRIDRAK